jgi:hypothetical protein
MRFASLPLEKSMFSSKSIRYGYSLHLLAAWKGNYAPMGFNRFVRTVAFASKGLQ